MSFPQKKKKNHDCNLSGVNLYINIATSWKKEQKPWNNENLDGTHFAPF